jgi:hypothetical protein
MNLIKDSTDEDLLNEFTEQQKYRISGILSPASPG